MNVPKLRFKEFNDEWIESNFSKTFSFISNNSLSRNDLNYDNQTNIFNIHYGDILTKMNNIVDVSNFAFPSINTQYLEKYNKKDNFLCNGDIVIADTAEDYTAGKSIELQCIKNEKIISGLHTIPLRPITGFSKNYLGYYLNSSYFHNQLIPLITGIKVMSITKSNLENTYIRYPSKNEQEKIGTFLQLLDKKIELQSKKIEALKLYKMCISKNFFDNKNLKTTLLKNICNIKKGQQLNNEYLKVNGIYYMLNGGMLPSGYTDNYNTLENTISISEGGNSCGYVNFNKEKFWSGGHCYTVEPININNEYLFQLLKYYEKAIMSLRVGSGLPNIQKKDLELFKVAIHTQDEQKNISKTLCKIDLKIDLENKKLFKLESLKKGLMQNMFV